MPSKLYLYICISASLTGARQARAESVDSPIRIVGGGLKASAMRTYLKPTLPVLLAAALVAPYSNANAEPIYQNTAIFKKGDCGLKVEDPHISDSLLKKKIVAIKVNVTSTCIYPQQKVTVTVTLFRKGFFGWVAIPAAPETIDKPKPSPFKVEFKKIYFECKSNKRTQYWAKAKATAVIAGQVHNSPEIYSQNNVYLNCGV